MQFLPRVSRYISRASEAPSIMPLENESKCHPNRIKHQHHSLGKDRSPVMKSQGSLGSHYTWGDCCSVYWMVCNHLKPTTILATESRIEPRAQKLILTKKGLRGGRFFCCLPKIKVCQSVAVKYRRSEITWQSRSARREKARWSWHHRQT